MKTISLKNLRKALKLIEQNRHVQVPDRHLSISYHNNFDSAITDAQSELQSILHNTVNSVNLQYQTRSLIEKANNENGINSLVTSLAHQQSLLTKLNLFRDFSPIEIKNKNLSETEFTHKQKQIQDGTVQTSPYDRNYTFEDYASVEFVENVKARIKECKNHIDDIQDSLSAKNSATLVEVEDELYDELMKLI